MTLRNPFRSLLLLAVVLTTAAVFTACSSSRSTSVGDVSAATVGAEASTAIDPIPAPTTQPEPPTAIPTLAPPTPTPIPTSTPEPTATAMPTPTAMPILNEDEVATLFGVDTSALVAGCPTVQDQRSTYPPRLTTVCNSPEAGATVGSPAAGYIIAINRQPARTVSSSAPLAHPIWAWGDAASMGEHVVIDHGAQAGHGNVTTVLWGFDVDEELFIGQRVETRTQLGNRADAVSMQVWLGESVFGEQAELNPLPFDEVQQIASELAPLMASPVAPECTVNFGAFSQLPNAGRPYRSGTHRGVDLICGTAGHEAFAALNGTVIAVTNDYVDAPVQNRLNVLANAAVAGDTPHWTLNLLFGNYVVIEHVDPDGREVITISAHLESVDPSIEVGGAVEAGDRLGEIGNRGTGPSAAGTTPVWDSSRHLHWEFYVDGQYLGRGLTVTETVAVYRTLLCGSAAMTGCT